MIDPTTAALTHLEGSAYIRFSVLALSSIFFLVDPFAALPTFLAVTAVQDARRRVRTARKASLTAFIVLTTFAFIGQYIFRVFGITLPAFEIAGGIILLLIGLDMLEAKRSPTQEVPPETEAASAKDDAGIVPMGIPMLAGPGAITSVMVCFIVLGSAARVARLLGETGIRILVRIMGLLLVALAVQYFVNGMQDLGVFLKPS
jgi:multiple antibiotic resistance protein